MIVKATSIFFDVVELRCDGKGAIGHLIFAMQASGIVLSIAGPDHFVAVVERMARTLKGCYRCHELSLPFLTTHAASCDVLCLACT